MGPQHGEVKVACPDAVLFSHCCALGGCFLLFGGDPSVTVTIRHSPHPRLTAHPLHTQAGPRSPEGCEGPRSRAAEDAARPTSLEAGSLVTQGSQPPGGCGLSVTTAVVLVLSKHFWFGCVSA